MMPRFFSHSPGEMLNEACALAAAAVERMLGRRRLEIYFVRTCIEKLDHDRVDAERLRSPRAGRRLRA